MKNIQQKTSKKVEKILEEIAQRHLRFTLVPQNSDRFDFHDVGVRSLHDALLEAYETGRKKL